VGIVIPAHASALGKAILAFEPSDEASSSRSTLRSMTGETITDEGELASQLKAVRESGVAFEQEEALIGECAIASPVFDGSHGAVGAIGIVVPSGAWPLDAAARDAVREAA